MAELQILLRRDPQTGKQNIIVKLDSDPDVLPMEHEELHRRLVEKLIGQGVSVEELGSLVIQRDTEIPADLIRASETEASSATSTQQAQPIR